LIQANWNAILQTPQYRITTSQNIAEGKKKCIICVLNLPIKTKRAFNKITESPFKYGAQEQNRTADTGIFSPI